MAHYAGSALYIAFSGTTVSGDQRSMDVNETITTYDTTAGADTDESHVRGVKSATFDMTILCNGTGGSAVRAALKTGASGTLEFAPEGTASGMPKYQCVATVTDHNMSYPYDGEVEFNVSLTKSGNWVTHYEHSGSTY